MLIRLMVTGRFYHEAACLPAEFELPEGATVEEALKWIDQASGEAKQPTTCLVAVNGDHLGTIATCAPRVLQDGDELTLIAPVAGG